MWGYWCPPPSRHIYPATELEPLMEAGLGSLTVLTLCCTSWVSGYAKPQDTTLGVGNAI